MSRLTRRRFLGSAAAVGAVAAGSSSASAAEGAPDYQVEDQQPFRGQTRRLKVTDRGRPVASLIFPTDYPTHFRLKPEWYPVCTPSGIPVTDSHQYCFIHHQSIMCGHGKVRIAGRERPLDFYRKLGFPESEREDRWHRDFNLFHMGPSGIQRIVKADWDVAGGEVVIDLTLEWQTREFNRESGETILLERRRYGISRKGAATVFDQFSRLVPVQGEAVLMADRHSFCGVRVNDLIDVEDGGTMRDSEGRVNPDGNYWDADGARKAPRWVDCSGRIGGVEAGMTLIAHPGNLRNQFYMRGWGLMEVSAMLGTDVRISGEQPFRFAARYAAHDGQLSMPDTEALHQDFAEKDSPVDVD